MPRSGIREPQAFESGPGSPSTLPSRIGDMILDSTACLAKVKAVKPETGEDRLVLQGILDNEETPWSSK